MMREIDLTPRQQDAAEWLLGCPSMCEWFEEGEGPSSFKYLERPYIEDGALYFPDDETVVNRAVYELERYGEMRPSDESIEEWSGRQRVANNLIDKIEGGA